MMINSISELSHMDSDERRRYFYSLNKYRTTQAVMENERYEGEHNKAIEIARSMKNDGIASLMISKYTGLVIDEIDSL